MNLCDEVISEEQRNAHTHSELFERLGVFAPRSIRPSDDSERNHHDAQEDDKDDVEHGSNDRQHDRCDSIVASRLRFSGPLLVCENCTISQHAKRIRRAAARWYKRHGVH